MKVGGSEASLAPAELGRLVDSKKRISSRVVLGLRPWHLLLSWFIGSAALWSYYAAEEDKTWIYCGAAAPGYLIAILEYWRRRQVDSKSVSCKSDANDEPTEFVRLDRASVFQATPSRSRSRAFRLAPWLVAALSLLLALTIWHGAAFIVILLAVGVPIRWLCAGRAPLNADDWILAPFLGIATIVPVMQGLVYLDVPVRKSWPLLWFVIVPLWGWFLTVTNLNDSGSGSLRAQIGLANSWDNIIFAAGLTGIITLTSGELILNGLNIIGPGANVLSVSGNNASRVFHVFGGVNTISGLTITGGRVFGDFARGAGIYNQSGATLTLASCTVSGNSISNVAHGQGGGIANLDGWRKGGQRRQSPRGRQPQG